MSVDRTSIITGALARAEVGVSARVRELYLAVAGDQLRSLRLEQPRHPDLASFAQRLRGALEQARRDEVRA